jgi:hypothetical protein
LPAAASSTSVGTYLVGLADHPDPAQRTPELVLRVLEKRPGLAEANWRFEVEALARVRLEDWAGALSAIDQRDLRSSLWALTPMARLFLHSLILSRLGRPGEARLCYERGMAEWDRVTAGQPGAWGQSDAMRWRREAEAALAKK